MNLNLPLQAQCYKSKVWRIVESQEKVATMRIVDSLDEQALLEALIETTKPTIHTEKPRHYLIQTPFRYPPLKHGSRFGSRYEPSIFYAGQTLQSALCESAFYSFYFMSRSLTPFAETIINHKTSFAVQIDAAKHLDLTEITDSATQQKLLDKADYHFTQAVGKQMRADGIQTFCYPSARCEENKNIGVFEIDAIKGNPSELMQWEIKQTPTEMIYYSSAKSALSQAYKLSDFMVDGELPNPSN